MASTHRERGPSTRWTARAVAVLTCLIAPYTALAALLPVRADAHPLSTTAILLDAGPDRVTGRVQLPIDRLALAVQQPNLTTAVAEQPAKIEEFRRYVLAHTSATDSRAGARWAVTVSGGRVET